jgi:hypothetical protein
MSDNLPFSEQYRLVAKQWVDADAAANLLEECKTPTLSQKMVALGDMPVSRAEMLVKASDEWHEYIKIMVEARKRANLLRAQKDYIEMRAKEYQSAEASKRAEMRL